MNILDDKVPGSRYLKEDFTFRSKTSGGRVRVKKNRCKLLFWKWTSPLIKTDPALSVIFNCTKPTDPPPNIILSKTNTSILCVSVKGESRQWTEPLGGQPSDRRGPVHPCDLRLWIQRIFQNSHKLTLDPNTAHKRLHLSEGDTEITGTDIDHSYPDHPDRFDYYRQVLCRESVCGRCYWEIEWSGRYVCISVSYKSISRKGRGDECWFGHNDQSWSLICCPNRYVFWHSKIQTVLPLVSSCRRIGVYVDHSAGTLSFYIVYSDTVSLIHTVQTTFTQPLYPGFGCGYVGSSVKLC
ncbi:Stonustoxin subunit beta [Labeo rohita]|uniref:Stonustoxin subunit beta n=1 Tax=Labeo rohita TaxID=84645 RepID=A0ABQ8MV86_LABRO|nr:Stonustoxin subunit beta [Labeo rohita]